MDRNNKKKEVEGWKCKEEGKKRNNRGKRRQRGQGHGE